MSSPTLDQLIRVDICQIVNQLDCLWTNPKFSVEWWDGLEWGVVHPMQI